MYTVLLNSTEERHSFYSFYDRFLQICNEHKEENKALAFAFILYDFENPQISKVLKDTDYWLSLNEISGKYLTVFSFHYKPKVRYRRRAGSSDRNVFEYLTIASTFNNPSADTNTLIEKYFGSIETKYPSVMFFQVDGESVIDSTLIELDENHIEASFLELKGYITTAVEALKMITNENKQNHKEIFQQVAGNVKSLRTAIVAKRIAKKLTSITELASSVVGLGS